MAPVKKPFPAWLTVLLVLALFAFLCLAARLNQLPPTRMNRRITLTSPLTLVEHYTMLLDALRDIGDRSKSRGAMVLPEQRKLNWIAKRAAEAIIK